MRKLALIIPAAVALGGFAYYIQILGSENALFEQYPDYDRKYVIKAHREIVKEVLTGKHKNATEEDYDKIIRRKMTTMKIADHFK